MQIDAGSLTLRVEDTSGRATRWLTAGVNFDEMIVGFGGGHSHGGPWAEPGDPDHELAGTVAFVEAILAERVVDCTLSNGGATPAEAARFRQGYRDNQNPAFEAVTILGAGDRVVWQAGAEPEPVRLGERLRVQVRWPACAEPAGEDPPAPCAGAEWYLYLDPEDREFRWRREALRVFWAADRASFAEARTGVAAEDLERTLENVFEVGGAPGPLRVWLVLRDDRGGVGWVEVRLSVGGIPLTTEKCSLGLAQRPQSWKTLHRLVGHKAQRDCNLAWRNVSEQHKCKEDDRSEGQKYAASIRSAWREGTRIGSGDSQDCKS